MTRPTVTNRSDAEKAAFWVGVAAVPIGLAILVPLVLVRAWVIAVLWGWYVVPAFGLAPLRLVYAFGLSLLLTFVLPPKDKNDDGFWINIGNAMMRVVVVLGMGWIGSWFA